MSDELPSVPPTLVLAGNIVRERAYGPEGQETRRGTHLFRPNTKVYLSSLDYCAAILSGDPLERIKVVGPHRASRRWIECWVPAPWVTNWRIQVLCQPGALRRLQEADWQGFWLQEDDFCLGEARSSPEVIRAFLEAVWKRYYAEHWRRDWDRRHAGLSQPLR